MMPIERIVRENDIRHALETYTEIIPALDQFSACLLIEYETPELRSVRLHDLLGLVSHVWMEVPGLPAAQARFDTLQIPTDRISSVQCVKLPLGADRTARFGPGTRIFVDHPRYPASTTLSAGQLAELAVDLA